MSLLVVKGLGKSFGGVKAVDGIDFTLEAGELLALIGPNGAGKSTTFNMVNGQLRADAGSIRLDGIELIGLQPRRIWKLGVGRTFQIAETFASLTVIENVQMALISADGRLLSMWPPAARHRREDALAHPYWRDAEPQSMLIDEVESLWAAIAGADDWQPLAGKVAAIRRMGEALGG